MLFVSLFIVGAVFWLGKAGAVADAQQVAALLTEPPIRTQINGRSELPLRSVNRDNPKMDNSPLATFVVDRTDDSNAAAAQVCSGAANDCSLRGAITKANATAGDDVITFDAATNGVPFTLTLVNAGGANEDANATGDLDVLASGGGLTITGNGSSNTIIQAGTTASNGIDKVFAFNPLCNTAAAFSISGATIRFGRNTQPFGAGDFSYSGGGIDVCGNGTAGMSFAISNSIVTQNTNTDGYGGGMNIDEAAPSAIAVTITNTQFTNNISKYWGGGLSILGDNGNVTVTGSTFSNNQTLGTAGAGAQGGGINVRITNQIDAGFPNPTPFVNIDTSTISNNQGLGYGGGIAISAPGQQNVTIQNSTISGNTIHNNLNVAGFGGGVYAETNPSFTTTLTNDIISGNHADDTGTMGATAVGGGVCIGFGLVTINGGTLITGNTTAGDGGGLAPFNSTSSVNMTGGVIANNTAKRNGGGVYLLNTGIATLSKVTLIGNTANSDNAGGGDGGAIYRDTTAGTLTMSFSRVANNIANTGGGGTGTQGLRNVATGTVTASNNWWGCSGGPGTAPCDTATSTSGTFTTTPFLRVKTTPNPTTLIVNQSTTSMIARVQDSTGTDIGVANLDVFVATNATAGSPLPITWSAVGGTLSGTTTPIASSGGFAQATGTYLATAANATNSATAKIDNDTTSGNTNTGSITVNKGNTTASITSQALTTTLVGQTFNVTFNAVPSNTTNSPTAMTGNVMVSDGVNNCSGAINGSGNGSCSIALSTVGTRTLTATYQGDGNFNASSPSSGLSHTVTNTATWTGASSTDWNAPGNWNTQLAPGSSNHADIPSGAVSFEPTIGAFAVTVTDLTVGSGHTLTVNGGGSLSSSGTATINGNFGGSGGTFGFNNLIINNAGGVSLTGNTTVTGLLTLTSGEVTTGANTLFVGTAGTAIRTNGFVIGTMQKAFGGASAYTYHVGTTGQYSPVDATVTAGMGNLSVKANTGTAPATPVLLPGITLQRYWTLVGSGITANLKWHYLDGDVAGNESNYKVIRVAGGSSTAVANGTPCPGAGSPCVDTAANTIYFGGISSFSDWTAGEQATTAAGVSVSGRVLNSDGRGVRNAVVSVTDQNGIVRSVFTSTLGNYRFDDIEAGQNYVLSVRSRRYRFIPRVITVTDELTGVDFVAEPY